MKADFRIFYQLTNCSGNSISKTSLPLICAEDIAIGTGARSNKVTQPTINLDDDETPHFEDEFLAANDVSYDMEGTPHSNLPNVVDDAPPSVDIDGSPILDSKRSSEKPTRSARCPKRKSGLQNLNHLLVESNKNDVAFKETIQ
ncbi:hypothetical protein M5K25_012040 [Dendrobium thyrsiflorum]|uniref:Uncharacterized protein n=1 Tax=Dendrobium thyrsiflorum TaxID=117978 RepID=A0ABD0V5N1_DENTH